MRRTSSPPLIQPFAPIRASSKGSVAPRLAGPSRAGANPYAGGPVSLLSMMGATNVKIGRRMAPPVARSSLRIVETMPTPGAQQFTPSPCEQKLGKTTSLAASLSLCPVQQAVTNAAGRHKPACGSATGHRPADLTRRIGRAGQKRSAARDQKPRGNTTNRRTSRVLERDLELGHGKAHTSRSATRYH